MSKTSVFLVTAEDEYGPLERPYGVFSSHREAKTSIYQIVVTEEDEMSDRGGHYEKFKITKHSLDRIGPPVKTWDINVDEL